MRLTDAVQVKSNLVLTCRERGKIVARREGHNIWVNLGRNYLASLICYSNYSPLTPERDDRIRYIGLGIGGTRQIAPSVANSAPMSVSYPGSNAQTDTSPTVSALERPVRLSGGALPYNSPPPPTDVWLGQVQAPVVHPATTQSLFKRLFTSVEISYDTFITVPLSEAGLFTNLAANNVAPKLLQPGYDATSFVAYDTFDTLSKTTAFELEVNWTIRF